MPFRFICSQCGAILHECGEEILRYQSSRNASRLDSLTPPIEAFIAHKIGDKCPKCGRRLAKKPLKVEVYPLRSIKNG